MTTPLTLPNGTPSLLESLSTHDLAQYYMYQMDMLTQAEGVLESLGISGWLNGNRVATENSLVVERRSTPDGVFLAAPAPGNHLPSFYNPEQWQGLVNEGGRVRNPRVSEMTTDQLRVDILRQHALLQNFQHAAVAMANFAKNIADATQPPMPEMDPE